MNAGVAAFRMVPDLLHRLREVSKEVEQQEGTIEKGQIKAALEPRGAKRGRTVIHPRYKLVGLFANEQKKKKKNSDVCIQLDNVYLKDYEPGFPYRCHCQYPSCLLLD